MFNVSIGKTGKTLAVDFEALPQNAKDYIIAYGLKQKLNDAGASITSDEVPDEAERAEQKFVVAEVALKALLSGDITTRQAADGKTLEQVEATKWLRAKYKEIFKVKIAELPDSSDEFLIAAISTKLGVSEETLVEKLTALSQKLAAKTREIRALKSSTNLDIEL